MIIGVLSVDLPQSLLIPWKRHLPALYAICAMMATFAGYIVHQQLHLMDQDSIGMIADE